MNIDEFDVKANEHLRHATAKLVELNNQLEDAIKDQRKKIESNRGFSRNILTGRISSLEKQIAMHKWAMAQHRTANITDIEH